MMKRLLFHNRLRRHDGATSSRSTVPVPMPVGVGVGVGLHTALVQRHGAVLRNAKWAAGLRWNHHPSSSGIGIDLGRGRSVSEPQQSPSSSSRQWLSTGSTLTSAPRRSMPLEKFPSKYTERHPVPSHIPRPPYAESGVIPYSYNSDPSSPIALATSSEYLDRMRRAGRVARTVLQQVACAQAKPGVTTEDIDLAVHHALIDDFGAYPSPLNYAGFPKSLCSSINEVICHGIPDSRPLEVGDVVSFDVSCFLDGVHGDNCATIIVGDQQDQQQQQGSGTDGTTTTVETDWRGIPVQTTGFFDPEHEEDVKRARRLVSAARESLYAAIHECTTGACLTQVGAAIQHVADSYGYSTVEKYRGHGIGTEFHTAPYVKHFRNDDTLELKPGMIFTIEPMLVEGAGDCWEWPSDGWTVVTSDGSRAAQFEHTILIREGGQTPEILTVLHEDENQY